MEITTKEFKHCHLVTLSGRIDSSTAPQFSEALDKLIQGIDGSFNTSVNEPNIEQKGGEDENNVL